MYDFITNLLNLKDKDIQILDIEIIGKNKLIHIQKVLKNEYCPSCQSRMHSKGVYIRTVNHPILQDGFELKLMVHQRRWHCTNPDCGLYFNDQFNFLSSYKQSSNITPYLILKELKNIHMTTSEIAKRYHVSDTTIHYYLRQYLDIKRLPFPEIISIDEVYLNLDYKHKYALVIFDFITGEIIDLLPNRWEKTTNAYFISIPLEERQKVKYLICDMYNPYINFTKRYFPNSIAIIDSFHVVSWLIRLINNYLIDLKKKYQERDKKAYIHYLEQKNKPIDSISLAEVPKSKEVYLINHYKWFILKNKDNINYRYKAKYNYKFKMYLNTYDLEKMFFDLDPNLSKIRFLKEKYIEFNTSEETNKDSLMKQLEDLIRLYSNSDLNIFKDFSKVLEVHKQEIINSFTFVLDSKKKKRRLSNGPIEGFNRTPKDFRRNSRGLENFEAVRNRIIWSNRKQEPVLAVPKSKEEVYTFKKKK
jgi:Transposase and inactivated derivatives